MENEESVGFKSFTQSAELIIHAGSSPIPGEVRSRLEKIPSIKPRPARRIMGVKLAELGVNRNPYVANRATKALLALTSITWGLTLLLLTGSLVNFYLLERINISATSHDARIEPTGKPVRIGNLD